MACETALRMNIPSASGRTLSCSARSPARIRADMSASMAVRGSRPSARRTSTCSIFPHASPCSGGHRQYSLRPPPGPAPRRLGEKRNAFRSSTQKRSTSSGAAWSTGRSATAGAAGKKAGKIARALASLARAARPSTQRKASRRSSSWRAASICLISHRKRESSLALASPPALQFGPSTDHLHSGPPIRPVTRAARIGEQCRLNGGPSHAVRHIWL